MVGAVDPYWGSLHCVRTLTVSLLAEMHKSVLATEPEGGGCTAELTSIGTLLNFFLTLIPNALQPSKTPLKRP